MTLPIKSDCVSTNKNLIPSQTKTNISVKFFLYFLAIYCMSQKTERPVLSGQRIKTRKRDEREKYDPTGFRDAVIAGLEKTEGDLEQISKFLDSAGNKLDYRRYGEVLFDILIAGGLLGKFIYTFSF